MVNRLNNEQIMNIRESLGAIKKTLEKLDEDTAENYETLSIVEEHLRDINGCTKRNVEDISDLKDMIKEHDELLYGNEDEEGIKEQVEFIVTSYDKIYNLKEDIINEFWKIMTYLAIGFVLYALQNAGILEYVWEYVGKTFTLVRFLF